ncbi:MAG: ABC transporter ATP-binding protein [Methanobacteriota archaeon]|nr:MAG: ABC transporter ATP-binding protein [Euryarchaeota archaeon]
MEERKTKDFPRSDSASGSSDQVVRTIGLSKSFGEVRAVADLDLSIPRGCVYGLIGPNGSGKTSTIRILNGLIRANAGRAWLLGEEVPVHVNICRIGYMPQEMAIYAELTVLENLELFAGMYSLNKESLAQRADALLDMIDLTERSDSLVSTLSGGMKHRVSLACALVHDPELVFLDEPTVGVDPELRMGFWDHFSDLKRAGKTIVLTTHYMDEAVRCDRVGMMRLGRMIAEDTPRGLMESTGETHLEDVFLHKAREGSA